MHRIHTLKATPGINRSHTHPGTHLCHTDWEEGVGSATRGRPCAITACPYPTQCSRWTRQTHLAARAVENVCERIVLVNIRLISLVHYKAKQIDKRSTYIKHIKIVISREQDPMAHTLTCTHLYVSAAQRAHTPSDPIARAAAQGRTANSRGGVAGREGRYE